MESQIGPVVNEAVIAYSIAHSLFLVLGLGLLFLLPVPEFVLLPAAILFMVADLSVFALRALEAYWVHLTQRYTIDNHHGYVRIRRGWASITSEVVPFRNISDVRAEMPLLLRMLGLGHVVIDTNDGEEHILYNVRNPQGIVETINPAPVETLFRPSVG